LHPSTFLDDAPQVGFVIGIELVMAWVCGLDHVRETIPFAWTLRRIYPSSTI
jgi:asparaginyl-tRNA synthetase